MDKQSFSKDGVRLGLIGVGGFLLVIAALAVLLFLLRFYSRESVYCYRNSLDFRLGITEAVIRNFPTPETTSPPRFYFSCGDGPKPPEQEVTFESSSDKKVLKKLFQEHIAKFGYRVTDQKDEFTIWYSNANRSLFLKIESTNSASIVRVSVIE
jgi:hypothetical protein